MAVPKRKHSKSRTRKKRNAHYVKSVVTAVKNKEGTGYKRPHVEEQIEV